MTVYRVLPEYHTVRDEATTGGYRFAHAHDVELNELERTSDVHYGLHNNPSTTDLGTDHHEMSTEELVRSSANKPCLLLDDHSLLNSASREHQPQRSQRFLSGWRVGVLVSFAGAVSVSVFNLVITIWVWKNPDYEVQGGIGMLLQSSCTRVRKLNVWIHLLVNALSTLLLCASNFCMQVLSAPNRTELDHAHAHRRWLHIGVPSPHNLLRVGRDRLLLWLIFGISSLPLHLLYNSVVFTNLQSNSYLVIPTTEAWLHGGPYDTSGFLDIGPQRTEDLIRPFASHRPDLSETIDVGAGLVIPRYKNISTEECFHKYSVQYMSEAGHVYLIQSNATVWRERGVWSLMANSSTGDIKWYRYKDIPEKLERQEVTSNFPFVSNATIYPSNEWRCPSHRIGNCNVDDEREVPRDRSKWAPYESTVRYCMVEQVSEICKLQFSFVIAIIVILSNFTKAACMGWMLFGNKSHKALVTLGDALASYLERPEPATRGRCLQNRWQFEQYWNARASKTLQVMGHVVREAKPERFKYEKEIWAKAPTRDRWLFTYVLYFLVVILGIVSIFLTLKDMPKDPVKLWKIGFGTVSGNNLFSISTSLMGGVLIANIPQAILSYLYLAFNALYTNMFVGKEWASYITKRKSLRVTSPMGQQRRAYWLSVPFRYAVPITILSGLFHWLASQSIFLVQITVTTTNQGVRTVSPSESISTCGFSPFAVILTTITSAVIAIGGSIVGRFHYPAGMPLAGSCSAAISAACHPPLEDIDPHLRPVKWGAVTHGVKGTDDEETIGHCSFSSLPVELPIPGQLYA